ncbi:unnamed protein product [Ectocarpus sp. CCAP 1310/34]|nr:unnamed protein product [Ectocarpus sp. CCAP 1310/34]
MFFQEGKLVLTLDYTLLILWGR